VKKKTWISNLVRTTGAKTYKTRTKQNKQTNKNTAQTNRQSA